MKLTTCLISAFSLFISFSLLAQDNPYDFMTIVVEKENGTVDQLVYYPEGSTHQVKSVNNQVIAVDSSSAGLFIYEGNLELVIFPQYRKEKPDYYSIRKQKLKVYTTAKAAFAAGFGSGWGYEYADIYKKDKPVAYSKTVSSYQSNGVSTEKELIPSSTNADQYNLKMTFSNGIVFTYTDGKYKATLDGEELYIKGKYLIESKLGTAKLSFNPSNGEVWWVFEKIKAE